MYRSLHSLFTIHYSLLKERLVTRDSGSFSHERGRGELLVTSHRLPETGQAPPDSFPDASCRLRFQRFDSADGPRMTVPPPGRPGPNVQAVKAFPPLPDATGEDSSPATIRYRHGPRTAW